MFVLVAVLAVQAFRSASNDRQAILENVMDQGYWIVRSLELGHGGMREEKIESSRAMVRELVQHEEILSLALVKHDGPLRVAVSTDRRNTPQTA